MRQITLRVYMIQVGDMDVRRCSNGNSATRVESSCTGGARVRVVAVGVMGSTHVGRGVVRYSGNGYPALAVRMTESDYWMTRGGPVGGSVPRLVKHNFSELPLRRIF